MHVVTVLCLMCPRMKESTLHGLFSLSLFPNIPSAVELAKVTNSSVNVRRMAPKHAIPLACSCFLPFPYLDALRPSERLKFWSGLLPQGNPLKLAINIKYGAFISARSSHFSVSLTPPLPPAPQAPELITTFDEHRVSLNFKFGILCQKEGQVRDLATGVCQRYGSTSRPVWWPEPLCRSPRRTYSATMRRARSL